MRKTEYKLFAGSKKELELIQKYAMMIDYTWKPIDPYKIRTGNPKFVYLNHDGTISIGCSLNKFIQSKHLYISSNSFFNIIMEFKHDRKTD